jgi:hypothetical protein
VEERRGTGQGQGWEEVAWVGVAEIGIGGRMGTILLERRMGIALLFDRYHWFLMHIVASSKEYRM